MKKWKILKSKLVLNHSWYKVRADTLKLPSGKVIKDYYLSIRDDYVIVFPLTLANKVVLIKQYKHGAGKILWELPGGLICKGEAARKTAIRELVEETGYEAQKIHLLGVFYDNPTKNTNKMYAFLATGITKKYQQSLDETEQIEIQEISLKKLKRMITNNLFTSMSSTLCTLLAISKLNQNI